MTFSPRRLIACVVVAGASMLAGSYSSTFAHHGGFVNWQQDVLIGPVTAVATGFTFRFPHPQFAVDIAGADGAIEPWNIVLRPTPTGLRDRGWSRNSIKPGDTLTLIYSPHRSAGNVGIARRILVNGQFLPIEPGDEACRETTTPYRNCRDVQ